ncbi:60S ribosomal protein L7 [Elsinoe australis]|uniref:60S ribosomal protein L7 n=1 Tax=Elsinoe australis TaxID=40998 RepID=A0A2P7YEW8_9PEZI|nr:60S ribosomal protein L7 [Elsinoe australis]
MWTTLNENSNSTTDPYKRPPGFGLMYENTTITASWIDIQPPLNEDGRIITNSSLAYPHAGVYQAARDPNNGILQPQELDGLGLYGVRASVASPVMNVLCIQTPNKADLDPLVYETWPAAGNFSQFNSTIWPAQIANITSSNFNNATALDKYFRWGNATEELLARPIFARYPIKHDTLLNHTQAVYGRDAIYLLGQGVGEYVICELSASLTPNCATDYNATASSGSMEAVCSNKTYSDIPRDRNADVDGDAIQGVSTRSKDWFEVAGEWGKSLALHTGISEGRGSNSRILMNLLLTPPEPGLPQRLKRATPSISEALAVMAGSTLMYSSLDAPFNTRQWNENFTSNILEVAQPETFKAWVRGQEYASGGIDAKSRAFLLILFPVFVFNALMLGYFLSQRGLVTDYSEPPNLFALALNSPPSHLLAGSCGAGPHGDQYKVNWFFQQENDHLYMESGAEPEGYTHGGTKMPYVDGEEIELVGSPHQAQFNTLSKRKSLL